MKDADRQRIERNLEQFDSWRASGIPLKTYVQQRGGDLASWRARLSWEGRWRHMLAGTYTRPASKSANAPANNAANAFVRAVPSPANAAAKVPAKPELHPSPLQDCLHIVLCAQSSPLQASIQWPLSHLQASSAWLRQVLA